MNPHLGVFSIMKPAKSGLVHFRKEMTHAQIAFFLDTRTFIIQFMLSRKLTQCMENNKFYVLVCTSSQS
jgi:hypothetical protein